MNHHEGSAPNPDEVPVRDQLPPTGETLNRFSEALGWLDKYADIETSTGATVVFGDVEAEANDEADTVVVEVHCSERTLSGYGVRNPRTAYELTVAPIMGETEEEELVVGFGYDQLGQDQAARLAIALDIAKGNMTDAQKSWLNKALKFAEYKDVEEQKTAVRELIDQLPEGEEAIRTEQHHVRSHVFDNHSVALVTWNVSAGELMIMFDDTAHNKRFYYQRQGDDRVILRTGEIPESSDAETGASYEQLMRDSAQVNAMPVIDGLQSEDVPQEGTMRQFVTALEEALDSSD